MKHNNLSNRSAPVIAFRIEDFLVKHKNKTIRDKIGNFIFGKDRRAELNPKVVQALEYIFRHTDYTSYLVIENGKYNNDIEKLIENIPYSRVIPVTKPVEIAILLNINNISYYVDSDESRMNMVSHNKCITLDNFNSIFR